MAFSASPRTRFGFESLPPALKRKDANDLIVCKGDERRCYCSKLMRVAFLTHFFSVEFRVFGCNRTDVTCGGGIS